MLVGQFYSPALFFAIALSTILPLLSFSFLATAPQHHHSSPRIAHTFSRTSCSTTSRFSSSSDDDDDNGTIYVMVNGMPGPMATAAAEACLRKGLRLCPFALMGPDKDPCTITVSDGTTYDDVRLLPSSNTKEIQAKLAGVRETLQEDDRLVAIDYTHPSAVNANAQFYVQEQIPFVMGTTGGDREQLLADTQGQVPCVIAPNMGKQIVAMQAALEYLASAYPGAFEGYTLKVTESHQKQKADTSGTAKAVIGNLMELTASPFSYEDDLTMIRNDEQAAAFGVPEDAVTSGHAFHTYTLTSPDETVQFALQHNVAGRTVYADGTADAVKFLARQKEKRVFTMVDVLKEGAME